MSAFDYTLTYAGVPFVTDTGMSYQANIPEEVGGMVSGRLTEVDLMAEVNRLISLQYLQDYTLPTNYPGRNLGAIAYRPQIGPEPDPTELKVGDYYYPFGMTRWSVFRGLMTSSMVKQVVANTAGGTVAKPFVLQQEPAGLPGLTASQYTITTSLFMLPPRPISEHGGSFDGLYLVTLVDERYYFQGDPCFLRPTQSSTWTSLIDAVASQLGITLTYDSIPAVYGQPEPDSQLWVNCENAALLLDALAFNVGRICVRNFDGTYQLLTPSESRSLVQASRGTISRLIRHAGGDLFSSGTKIPAGSLVKNRNSVVPSEVRVTFPKYVEGNDPVPHFLNPRYTSGRPSCWFEESYGDVHVVSIPVRSGGSLVSGVSGTFTQLIHDTAKAYYATEAQAVSGGTPTNASGLQALALQVAEDFYSTQGAAALDEVYPGIFAWDPEGIHDIIWTYSNKARGCFTRVMKTEWNNYPDRLQHASIAGSGTIIPVGVGGPSVAQTWRAGTGGAAVSGPVYGANLVTVGSGLRVIPGSQTSGGISEAVLTGGTSGRLIGVRYLTDSSGTYTPTTGTVSIFVELLGGGGAGGGVIVTNDATEGAVGGGGGAGTYTAIFIDGVAASYTYEVGAGGTGGGASGGTGGTTTFNGGAVTAPGGDGGDGNTGTTGFQRTGAGVHSTAGTGGDITVRGQAGGIGWLLLVTPPAVLYEGGYGGSSMLGAGGRSTTSSPSAGLGYGAGGGGAVLTASGSGIAAQVNGGDGAQGVIRIWEFGA